MFWILVPSFIVLDLLWWGLADRGVRDLPHARIWRIALTALVAPMIVYLLLSMFWAVPIRSSGGLPVVVHTFIYLWHFLTLPILTLVMMTRIAWRKMRGVSAPNHAAPGAAEGIAGSRRGFGAAADPLLVPIEPQGLSPIARDKKQPALPALSRRQILTAAAVGLPPLATGLTSAWSVQNLNRLRTRRFTLTLPALPRQLDGLTIAHVSDTHIGKFLNPDRLPAIAREINNFNADFIAFTGDLIDLSLEDLPFGIDFLRSLKSRCGMVVCEGNHDVMQNRGDFEHAMREADLPIMIGDQRMLNFTSRLGKSYPVQFLAVPWNGDDREMADAVDVLRPEVNPQAFPILLAHHPHSFDEAAVAHFPLVLSGHTHGGQIMITSQFGAGSLRFRYTSGLYQKPGSSLIVNNGIGNWFPLRINAPAELVHITLRSV
ncbi:MAG TPA: metallophosphoesterase [Tepidisphaeraceae bacterium]|jgi:hypothetical protein|nr:metallophosphoesterase [Tepidisphaeraceae bacterium]